MYSRLHKSTVTYTWDPDCGITSETDAAGVTTCYSYDSFRRLSSLRNGEGQLMEDYDYHFKQ